MAYSDFVRQLEAGWRPDAPQTAFDPRPLLRGAQVEAYADPTRHRAWKAGRRGGKTTLAEYVMLEAATTTERCVVVYLSTTINRAVKTVWDELKDLNRDHGLGGLVSEQDNDFHFPNGSVLYVSGAETKKLVDRWRGPKRIKLFVLDEFQDWPDDLRRYAIGSVVIPALADLKGRMLICGTGGAPRGHWHQITSDKSLGYGVKRWTIFDNPAIPDPQGEVEAACKSRGVGMEDPSIRREYFGEDTEDSTRQIFVARPTCKADEVPKGAQHIISADFGTVDACAVVVYAFAATDPRLYIVEGGRRTGLGASDQVKFVRAYVERYRRTLAGVVGDGGGLGKALILDLQAAEKFFEIEPALKANKVPAVRLLRDGLRSGAVVIVETEAELAEALREPEWHPDHIGEKVNGHMPDLVDGALYGYRKASELHVYTPPPPPDKRTPEQKDRDAEKARAEAKRKAGSERRVGWREWMR